jgi:hypothetical protein
MTDQQILSDYFTWLKKLVEIAGCQESDANFIIVNLDGSIEISVDGDNWICADNYKDAQKQYLQTLIDFKEE